MRGKLLLSIIGALLTRNIPAYAGKTVPPQTFSHPGPEHPRVCGENHRVKLAREVAEGTSPRMRGKRLRKTSLRR